MSTVACSCGEKFIPGSPAEVLHFVWAVRPDGTRSNLGECPVKRGGVEAAKAWLINNNYAWNGGQSGFIYNGERV